MLNFYLVALAGLGLNTTALHEPGDHYLEQVSGYAGPEYEEKHQGTEASGFRLLGQIPNDKTHKQDQAADHQWGDPGFEGVCV